MNQCLSSSFIRYWPIDVLLIIFSAFLMAPAGCNSAPETMRNDLEKMETAGINIKGQPFEVWLATTPQEQQLGLMQVTEDELSCLPDETGQTVPGIQQGMLFIFPVERILSFWMHNTIIPLDIAYIRQDGIIVNISTMAPLETRTYPSVEPAMFALEVKAGLFAQLGIGPGDRVEFPDSVLKPRP
ncbi:MAG: DUF192 domain-containing protein [Planctomycetota bacterium]|nr:MAG: DUF192 domain-containing protein [Planctomycetota bacterium]